MARPGRVGRGGRDRREEEAVEAAPLMTTQDMTALNFAEPPRQSRGSRGRTGGGGGGGSFIGTIIPIAAGFVAAIVTAIAGMVLAGGKPAGDPGADQMAANAAILLASTEPDWWEPKTGILPTLGELFKKNYEDRREKMKRDEETGEADLEAFRLDYEAALTKWDIQPAGEREADVARVISDANTKRLQKIVQGAYPGSSILWVGVVKGQNQLVLSSGQQPSVAGYLPVKAYGAVQVTPVQLQMATGLLPARIVEAPMTDRSGNPAAGKVRLIVTAPAPAASGGAAMAAVFALVALLVVGGATFAMCAGVSGGLRRVTRDIEQIAQGDLDVRIAARGGGEVAALSKAVDRAMKTFRAVQEQTVAAAAAAQHAVVATEQVEAVSLLPAEPPKVDGFEIEAVHKPCPSKGNDFYDYIRVDDERIGVVVAEMPQRGSKGAFIASTFRALMRAFAAGEQSPAAVLAKVNRIMANELKRGDHIKAMYTILDMPKSIVSVASAGHLPLIFWKLAKKGSALLSPEGIAIGLDKGPVFEKTVVDKRIKMEKGDRFVLHTDGPVAAKNAEGEEYGEQRFYYLVNREAPKNSAAFVNFVANEVDLFHGGAEQQDDISIVTVRKIAD